MGVRGSLGVLTVLAIGMSRVSLAGAPPAPGDRMQVHAVDDTIDVRVTLEGLVGPDVQVSRLGTELRGRAFHQTVQLSWGSDRITGTVADGPVDLKVVSVGDGIRIEGLYAGLLGNLRISPHEIEGSVGACTYSLRRVGERFEGQHGCRSHPIELANVVLPASLDALPAAERAAFLVVILSH